MGANRRVRGAAERLFGDGRSALARRYRRECAALSETLEIGDHALLRDDVARCAMARIRAWTSAKLWAQLVEQRELGKGRRPNLRAIERARRAAALDEQTAAASFDRLRLLAKECQPPMTLADYLAQRNGS